MSKISFSYKASMIDRKAEETVHVGDKQGIKYEVDYIKIKFGPHYYININNKDGKITFNLGATHHGFTVDASKVDSDIEKIIDLIRNNFPELKQD